MRNHHLLLVVLLGWTCTFASQDSTIQSVPVSSSNAPWMDGEKLVFTIGYGMIEAGRATMLVRADSTDDGKGGKTLSDKLEFISLAHNNGFFESVYPVQDTVYTRVKRKGLLPEVFRKTIHEGGWHNQTLIRFDRAGGKAWLSDTVFHDLQRKKKKRSKDTTVAITGPEHSITSAFYMLRTLDLEPGKDHFFEAVSGSKKYQMRVITHKRETIKVPAGKFKCLKVEPVLHGDGLFKSKGKLTIWLTDDERRIPVLMRSQIAVGSIHAELLRFEP